MRIIKSIGQMREFSKVARLENKTIGFVPTMGALHDGHLSLIRSARRENDFVVVSIFVNPIQFGPKEDFRKYPCPFKKDASLCRKAGVDIIFHPKPNDMYGPDFKTYVEVMGLDKYLCGRLRPGHFRGVATVVGKLFNIVMPDTAYFGQKDAQQARIITKMAEDLNMPVKIKIMPIVREKDGLALSSRNIHLNQDERQDAAILFQALNLAKVLIKNGQLNPGKIIRQMRNLINTKKTASVQYISIADLKDLKPVKRIKGKVIVALAVFIGKTRLIDNIIVNRKLGNVP